MNQTTRLLSVVLFIATMGYMDTVAARGLKIGEKAPSRKGLAGIDGKEHSAAELAEAKAVAIIFFANHCPDCQNYTDRIIALERDYREKGVAMVLVSVSQVPEDDLAHMKEWADEKNFTGLYLMDRSQCIGRDYGATVTPQIFILDGNGKLVYRGAIDDHWKSAKAKVPYARQALDAILVGKAPPVSETEADGCTIVYEGQE